ncbi:AAA family ATPase [Arthrobacter sp. CP30]
MSAAGATTGLVGRARLLKEVAAALDDVGSFGAMIVGEAGVGKTSVARAVLEQLRWPAAVLRVTGGASLRAIPFGALAPYLHTLSAAEAESPVAILRAVMSHLTAGAPTRSQRPPLVVVDDAHELDASTSALLAQLVSARRAKLLVMMRERPSIPADLRAFGSDGLLQRFELRALDPDDITELCSQVLGGPVLTGSVQALAMTTGGNPLFLRTLLEQGVSQGYLQQRNGVWRLTNEQPRIDLRLGDLIRSQLRARSHEDMEALEVVALAEPIALAALAACVDATALERLRDDRLLAVGTEPGRPVTLEQPLYGDVLRAHVPAARSIDVRRRVLAALGAEDQSLEGFLRAVSWGLDCGDRPDDTTLLRAAMVANGLRDHDFALRAVRAVSTPGLRGRVLTEVARVQAGRGNLSHARELVDEALRTCKDFPVARDAIRLSLELKLKSGSPSEDLRVDVDRWRSLVTRMQSSDGFQPSDAELEQAHLGTRVLESHVLLLEGRFDGLESDLLDVMNHPDGTDDTRVASMILLSELLGSMGRSEEGSAHSALALELIEAGGAALLGHRESAAARHVLLLTNIGRGAEAKSVLRAHSRVHPRSIVHLAGWGDVVDGIIALRASRNREARDRFMLALEALRESDVPQVMTLLTGMAAYASALAGDQERARALVADFERTPDRGSRTVRLGGRVFVTATAALLGDSPGARADLIAIAETAGRDGMLELAGTALRLSLLLGDTSAVDPLLTVLQGIEGSGAADLFAFAAAAKAKDADAMVAAATMAGARGNTAFEFAGLSLALQFMGEQGAGRRARSIQRRIVTLGELREGPVPRPLAAVSPAATSPRLTPTERAIVGLVKDGRSNREIAQAKGVSVRTVEGHLYRIFAKLGVNRREDLRGA